MNVLVFTSLYPNNVWPRHGIFVKERITRFAALQGHAVRVVAPVPYFPPLRINRRWLFSQVAPHEAIEGLEVRHPRYFMIPKVAMIFQGWLMALSVLPFVRRLQADFPFDLIDAHYVYPDGFAAVLLARALGKPVVVSARGSDINVFASLPLICRFLRYALLRADAVVAVSQALKQAMLPLGIPPKKIAVIPNGVDPKMFHPVPTRDARRTLRLPDARIILSVGQLIPSKGFDLLVRALRILIHERGERDLYLVIVGEGGLRGSLQRMISAHGLDQFVRLVGEVPHEKLRFWYSAADLFCLASSREGCPNVLLESLACGTPVAATAVGGIPEIIRSDDLGVLMERDERDIASKISSALRNPWRREAIVAYAHQHTWERTALSMSQVFTSVVKGESVSGGVIDPVTAGRS